VKYPYRGGEHAYEATDRYADFFSLAFYSTSKEGIEYPCPLVETQNQVIGKAPSFRGKPTEGNGSTQRLGMHVGPLKPAVSFVGLGYLIA
jgi:hypothetical protein